MQQPAISPDWEHAFRRMASALRHYEWLGKPGGSAISHCLVCDHNSVTGHAEDCPWLLVKFRTKPLDDDYYPMDKYEEKP